MRKIPGVFLLCALILLSTSCAGLTDQQQRALSGGAIGAGGGAVFGALTGGSVALGAALGGAAGAAGGLLIHELEKDKGEKNKGK